MFIFYKNLLRNVKCKYITKNSKHFVYATISVIRIRKIKWKKEILGILGLHLYWQQ